MLEINENGKVLGKVIHAAIESKTKQFNIWINRAIKEADLKEGKDFCTILYESTGGRPSRDYEFTIEAAKEICLLERNEKGKQIRRWLIDLSDQRERGDLKTDKEFVFMLRVIECLQYMTNQKEAFELHQDYYLKQSRSKNPFAEFYKYRAGIIGWNKQQVDEAFNKWLLTQGRASTALTTMNEKINVMDAPEAIRIAVMDILYAKGTDEQLTTKFARAIKNLAKELEVQSKRKNETTMFDNAKPVIPVNQIELH
jgi:phage anti-repressor protein